MTKRLPIAFVLAVLAVLAFGATLAVGNGTPSVIYGTRVVLEENSPIFHGRVGSHRLSCQRHRKVRIVRFSTHVIRRRGTWGPFRNLHVGNSHVHHFVPGIVIAFLSGGASIVLRDERLGPLLAIPFGSGVALTLDESALLLRLDDVYWTEEGIVSVHIMLSLLGGLAGAALLLKLLRRGEEQVLQPLGSAQ